jgi:beta-aspartyl-peptidase (threonine type)
VTLLRCEYLLLLLGLLVILAGVILTGCASRSGVGLPAGPPAGAPVADWAVAIHGGAGTLDRGASAAEQQEHRDALRAVLAAGRDRLARGDAALDVCEAVVRMLEDDPHFNAGKGAVFNEKGQHELDASIMDGSTLACGAVTGVRTVRNPVSLARLVMTKTPHVLLMGDGAEEFATAMGVERVPNEWFDTDARRHAWQRWRRAQGGTAQVPRRPRDSYGTVGCVARDRQGRLAAATSTGGLTGKKWGRVGDTPVLGAGNWADGWAAVSGTGIGEEFIRHAVARTVAARMQFAGESLAAAVDAVVFHTLRKDDGGVIAVDRAGNLSAAYNSEGMYRGLADANGRFEVLMFEQ